ncbi:fungal Zn(2)-Cys(6) binuclear cluster domain-containing protein 2 [Elsinoe australis]|uniref:Fungal Zn(2)-Cys(6) binuclear cluster domain-containing protein 2 n=1 Tax=Elsinoe australis TaxID=40998 RepID=A0A4U7BCA1_9PEZI|nr:fungal Zn(2)-Cys(6) binuclear cluster domain-containing protein 2 [Elsinoe australis]
MFATLGRSQREGTLQTVEQSTKLPMPSQGPQHDACCECRQKKLKCTGEKSGCSRCVNQGKACVYTTSRAGKRDSQQKTVHGSRPRLSPSPPEQQSAEQDGGRNRFPDERTNTTMPPVDASSKVDTPLGTSEAFNLNADEPSASHQIWPDRLTTDDYFGFDSSLTAFDDCLDDVPDAMLGPSHPRKGTDIDMAGVDVDFDSLFAFPESPGHEKLAPLATPPVQDAVAPLNLMVPMPTERHAWPSKNRQSFTRLRVAPQRLPPTPFEMEANPNSAGDIATPTSISPHSRRGTLSSRRSEQTKGSPKQGHQCLLTSLKLLERAHLGPKNRAHASELFRFLVDVKRYITSISSLKSCNYCTKSSQYLTLLSVVIERVVNGLVEIGRILTGRCIDISTVEGLHDYGVDSVDEFVDMYGSLALSHLAAFRGLISDLGQMCAGERWRAPFENLRLANERLSTLEQDLS